MESSTETSSAVITTNGNSSSSSSSSSSGTNKEVTTLPAANANPRGIPKTLFIENVEEFMSNEENTDNALRSMQEVYSKYKYMEMQLVRSKNALKIKIPDIRSTLDMARYLKEKKESDEIVSAHYELSDQVFATAKVKPSTVCLWLGANVMVEYPFEEAIELLTRNLENAEKNVMNIEEDISFLKDQITTTEVNFARVYNYDVKQRRKKREQDQAVP